MAPERIAFFPNDPGAAPRGPHITAGRRTGAPAPRPAGTARP